MHILYALLILLFTIATGSIAHVHLESLNWFDAILNTALVVSGIGPYIIPETATGKLFLSAYSMIALVTTLAEAAAASKGVSTSDENRLIL